jgi:hypothetical protein
MIQGQIKECTYMLNWVYKQIDGVKSRTPIPNTPCQIAQSGRLKSLNNIKTKLESRLEKLYKKQYQ